MTREHKLALIIGFSLVLVVGVLISDHFSKARSSPLATEIAPGNAERFGADTRGMRVVSASGPTIITPPGTHAGPPDLLPPAVETPPVPSGGETEIVMGVPSRSGAESLLQKAIGPGNGTALVQPGRDPFPINDPAAGGGVRPIDPTLGVPSPLPGPATGPGTASAELIVPPSPPVAPDREPRREEGVNGVPLRMMTRHDVREGESAYRIAQEQYGDGKLWPKLLEYNKGKMNSNGGLREGVTLLLPPREALLGKPLPTQEAAGGPTVKEPVRTAKSSEKPQTKPVKAEPKSDKSKTYTVQKGDSLSDIARRTLGSTKRWSEIVAINKGVLDDEDSLVVGMVLKLPSR